MRQSTEEDSSILAKTSLWSNPVIWLALVLYLAISVIPFFLPVSFPVLKRVFGSSLEGLGLMQASFYFGALGLVLGGGSILTLRGYRVGLAATLATLAAALAFVGAARNPAMVVFGAFFAGTGVLSVEVITSCLVSDLFNARRQILFLVLGLTGATGCILGPATLGWWLKHAAQFGGTWRTAFYFAAAIMGALALWPILLRPSALAGASAAPRSRRRTPPSLKKLLRDPAIYTVCALSLLRAVPDGGMVSFIGLFTSKKFVLDTAAAALFVSAYGAGILGGRSVLVGITARWKIPDLLLFSVCMGSASLAFAATIVAPTYHSGLVLFGLAGAFSSGAGPCLSSYLGSRFAPHLATAYGLMAGVNYLGGAGGCYLIGRMGTHAGLERGMWTMPFFSLAVAVVAIVWWRHPAGIRTEHPRAEIVSLGTSALTAQQKE